MGKSKKSLEDKYQKKTLHEQILLRPDTYVGSIEETKVNLWIYNLDGSKDEAKIINKEINLVPGLYKIFDEILVNARDHYVRCITEKRKHKCNEIRVNIDQKKNKITVYNNGDGIDIAIHKEHKTWIPTMIFGELLTSTNYDDKEEKIVGGRNGYGSKLVNIFSTKFEVETVDANTNQIFIQKWTDNMFKTSKPEISKCKDKPYTKITFYPDLEKFGISEITDDFFALMKKRTCDIAMTTKADVYFNDKLVKINNFSNYVESYFPEGADFVKVIDKTPGNDRWRVCVVYDKSDSIIHQNISFVNAICTSRGGSHVDSVSDQVVAGLREAVEKKLKKTSVKPQQIKENLIFFVDTDVVNPQFDTQTKEFLTTKSSNIGSKFIATEKFIKGIIKTGVVEQIIANVKAKEEANLSKTDGGRKSSINIPKLYDAIKAGTKQSQDCYLILTEGDSAKAFAMAGLNVCGNDYFGVFPLRGKVLNVRDESASKVANNEEISAIKKILGLRQGVKYTDTKELRYGHLMIMTDQDADGSHIKGLIMNLFDSFWEDLVKIKGFINSFKTPLVIATKGKEKKKIFFTMEEYEIWKNKSDNDKWNIKYYKGLGTHTSKEAQEWFKNIFENMTSYVYEKERKEEDEDVPEDEKIIPVHKNPNKEAFTLAFDKKRADDRKKWLINHNKNAFIDSSLKEISYHDFINKELILFSQYDVCRSVPNIMDGFKPSQRKIYFGTCKAGLYDEKKTTKVLQLAGYVAQHAHYHHGETSLQGAIINMAQNFVGSNNINLLIPDGQFGSRLSGGKDAAAVRYIFTYLNNLSRCIFNDLDYDILTKQFEDGTQIEPKNYVGIVPNILINGTQGIGTGYSTTIEPCNPSDIIDNLRRIINGEKPKRMKPWYRNHRGTIERFDDGKEGLKYRCYGIYDIVNEDVLEITELPIGTWTDDYKAFLENLESTGATMRSENKKIAKKEEKNSGSKKSNVRGKKFVKKDPKTSKTAQVAKANTIAQYIKKVDSYCTDIKIKFVVRFMPGTLKKLIKSDKFESQLKLYTNLSLNNMYLFDPNNKIKKYENYSEILYDFADERLRVYQVRKDHLLGKWQDEIDTLSWRMKFIKYVISGKIVIFKDGKSNKEEKVIERLEELGFPKFATDEKKKSYSYLLEMPVRRFTQDQIDKLQKMIDDKIEDIETLKVKSPSDLWSEELDIFAEKYEIWNDEMTREYEESMKSNKKVSKRRGSKKNLD